MLGRVWQRSLSPFFHHPQRQIALPLRLKHSMRALHDMPIDACDRRIAALERELAELKRYRNALTPICRLPAETLAAILIYVQHGGQDCDVRDPWRTYNFEWVRMMLVCRPFRDVALGASELWKYVDFGRQRWSPLWTEAFLRNARHPVVIRDRSGLGEARQFFMKALSADVLVNEAMADNLIGLPAPLIQSLRLESSSNLYRITDSSNVHRITVGPSFLQGTATLLHTLCLNGVVIWADIPDLPSLCLLELIGVYFYPGINVLTRVIARSPQLCTLCLEDVRPCRPEPPSQKALSRALPDLQNLYIRGSPSDVAQYMRALPVPSKSLGILLRDEDDEPDWDDEHYTYAYDMWTRHAAAHSLDLERVVVLGNETMCAHVNIGLPIPLSEFSATPKSFFSIHSTMLCSHPILAGIDTVHVRQPRRYDEAPCYDYEDAFGIGAMSDLRVVVLDGLGPGPDRDPLMVTEDDIWHLGLVEDVRSWVIARKGRVTDVRFEECSVDWVDIAKDLKSMGFSVTWQDEDESG
jgi:hypothetical protein